MNIKLIIIVLLIILIIYLFLKINNKYEHAGNVGNVGFSREAYSTVATVLTNPNVMVPTITLSNINTNMGKFNDISGTNANITNSLKTNSINILNNQSSQNAKYNNLQGNTLTTKDAIIRNNINAKNINIEGNAIIGGNIKIKNFNPTGTGSFSNNIDINLLNAISAIFSEDITAEDGVFTSELTGKKNTSNQISSKKGIFTGDITTKNGNFTGTIVSKNDKFNEINVNNLTVNKNFQGPETSFNTFSSDIGRFDTITSKKIIAEEASIPNITTTKINNIGNTNFIDDSNLEIMFNTISGGTANLGNINSNNTNIKYLNTDNLNTKVGNFNNINITTKNTNNKIITDEISNINNITSENIVVKDNINLNKAYLDNVTLNGQNTKFNNSVNLGQYIDKLCFSPSKCLDNNSNLLNILQPWFSPLINNQDIITEINSFSPIYSPISPFYLPNSSSNSGDNFVIWDNNMVKSKLLTYLNANNDIRLIRDGNIVTLAATDKPQFWTSGIADLTSASNTLWNGKIIYTTSSIVANQSNYNIGKNKCGIQIKVPVHPNAAKGQDYSVLWIQVLNDRWTNVFVHNEKTVNNVTSVKEFGRFTGGYKKTGLSFPNPQDLITNKNDSVYFYWMPIPINLVDTDRTVRLSFFRAGDVGNGIFFTQIAFSTNRYNHCKTNAISIYWQIWQSYLPKPPAAKPPSLPYQDINNYASSTTSPTLTTAGYIGRGYIESNDYISRSPSYPVGYHLNNWGFITALQEQLAYIVSQRAFKISIPFVNNGKDKTLYLIEKYDLNFAKTFEKNVYKPYDISCNIYNSSPLITTDTNGFTNNVSLNKLNSITLDTVPVNSLLFSEKFTIIDMLDNNPNIIQTFYTNKYNNSRYYSVTIPVKFLPSSNFLTFEIFVTNNGLPEDSKLYFKEMGVHDVI